MALVMQKTRPARVLLEQRGVSPCARNSFAGWAFAPNLVSPLRKGSRRPRPGLSLCGIAEGVLKS